MLPRSNVMCDKSRYSILIIIVAFAILIWIGAKLAIDRQIQFEDNLDNINAHNIVGSELTESWGCSTIYIDLGANIGVQIRKLFEPDKYPGQSSRLKRTMKYYDNILGSVENRKTNCCAFGFEANANHKARLKEIQSCYNKKGWKTSFDIKAVLDTDNETVRINTNNMSTKEDFGANIISRRKSKQYLNVSTIDIAKWIWNVIQLYEPKHILIKMDIEGAEYKVIPKMFEIGILCKKYIDMIMFENHKWAQGRWDNGNFTMESLLERIKTSQKCEPTNIVFHDDESYLHDKQPLPVCNGSMI